jgi:hypothetical protein
LVNTSAMQLFALRESEDYCGLLRTGPESSRLRISHE